MNMLDLSVAYLIIVYWICKYVLFDYEYFCMLLINWDTSYFEFLFY